MKTNNDNLNIIGFFRKPYLATFMSILILFVSCEQYDRNKIERSFDYSIYQSYLDNPINLSKFDLDSFRKTSTLQLNQAILDSVNNEYQTNIVIPNVALTLTDYSHDEIFQIGLRENFISIVDIDLVTNFMFDLDKDGFDVALENFESDVIDLNPTNVRFNEYNQFANALKIIKDANPDFFNIQGNRTGWDCAFALIALALTIVTLVACATIILCWLAYAAFLLAARNVGKQCSHEGIGEEGGPGGPQQQ